MRFGLSLAARYVVNFSAEKKSANSYGSVSESLVPVLSISDISTGPRNE